MHENGDFLLALGAILLIGLITSEIGRRTPLPRVTLLLVLGIVVGEQGLGIVSSAITVHFEMIATMTLLLIGFLLGGKLTFSSLRVTAKKILWISASEAVLTVVLVSTGLWAAGVDFGLALILGCIASASAPAAVYDVIAELNIHNRFSDLLLGVVAMDDIWALVLFGVGMTVVSLLYVNGDASSLTSAVWELFGAVILGLVVGLPAAFLTGRIRSGQPMLIEALGIVFLCGGIAFWWEVSFLLAAIVTGAVIANFARHHEYPFHAIEDIEWPFMIVFFVLAGATLELDALSSLGMIGAIYVVMRIAGKLSGSYFGALASKTDADSSRWIGLALLPQAGVNIGMALVAAHRFPDYRDTLLAITISSTVLFELFGPVMTRTAVQKVK